MNTFAYYLDTVNEFGVVDEISYPIVTVRGLPRAKPQEIVIFETGQLGEIYALYADSCHVLLFSPDHVQVGTKLVRTNKILTVPVGEALLGHLIDPLGKPLSAAEKLEVFQEEREIDSKPLGIAFHSRIKKSFVTGTSIVDMMVPLGKGQKELVIGDRKTGKSSFLFTTIKHQVLDGAIAVYAAIGKKKSDIKFLQERLMAEGLSKRVIIVATSSSDSPSFIYLTPYTAMTIAEYFRDQGQDVLVVLDDLSTHARFYREIALLARNFPGRDSYPGDIFYTHARLLERAGNFKHQTKGEVAITCLPIVETVDGDLTNYIATTIMGITDGHIFFDSNIFYKGRRPAVNIGLSVTRVGKQTQSKLNRTITRELLSFFSLYDRMQNLSHFGTELTQSVKNILAMGDLLNLFFDQPYTVIIPETVQIILFSLLWIKIIDPDKETLEHIRDTLIKAYQEKDTKQLLDEIIHVDTLNDLLRNVSLYKDKLTALWKKETN